MRVATRLVMCAPPCCPSCRCPPSKRVPSRASIRDSGPCDKCRAVAFRERYGSVWDTRLVTLRIDVLGTPRIEVDGEPLGVDTRKATALLAYLAVTGGVHGRDLLVDLLWPEAEPDRGRAALRRTLSTLRSALGGRWLDADRAAVGLALED